MSRFKHACTIIRARCHSAPPWRASRCTFGHTRPPQGTQSPELPSEEHNQRKLAQGMVEFALALPILLLLVFGIIEFGRLLQAWLAMENGARFGVRYAVTGSYNPTYCDQADAALSLQYDDMLDGDADCRVPDKYPSGVNAGQPVPNAEEKTNRLQDWARLPSVRDAAISGATGIAWDNRTTVSGDYLNFLTHAFSDKQTCTDAGGSTVPCPDYRGNPSAKGYFTITVCSNRANASDDYDPYNDDGASFLFNPNPFYFNPSSPNPLPSDPTQLDLLRFPTYCEEVDQSSTVVRYIDDAGGPGDRVRLILTYRHTLITPFVSNWWPTLRLTSEREGIVEKFRTSRVTGLSGAVAQAATWTSTPLPNTATFTPTTTQTPTVTNTVTLTPTRTTTFTPTLTATPYCGAITFGSSSDANLDLDDGLKGINVYMKNTSNLPVVLTGEKIDWLNNWNTIAADVRVPDVNTGFGWYSGSLTTFWTMPTSGANAQVTMTSAPMSWDRNFATTYTVTAGSSGQLVAILKNNLEQASFAAPNAPTDVFNYYHGSDFQITVRYTIGGLACSQTVTGYDGPRIAPIVTNSGGVVGIDSGATGWAAASSSWTKSALNLVTFTVFDSSNTMVHYQRNGGSPWCMFKSGSSCVTRRVYVDTWSINNVAGAVIQPGTYTVHIIARDKNTGAYATHITLPLVIPVGSTPTITLTSTVTRTPLPTSTATNTRTPLPTPTKTLIPSNTVPPTATTIPTITRTPTRTNTRPPTSTPTECQTPIEMGGCR